MGTLLKQQENDLQLLTRQTLLSSQLKEVLEKQIKFGIDIQCKDNKRGVGCSLPPGLSRKYPNAFKSDA